MSCAKQELFARKVLLKNNIVPEKVKLIQKYSSGCSLDAGCGDGQYFPYFNSQQLVAFDISIIRLKRIIKTGRPASIILTDIRSLPFRNRIFDFVWSSEVLEHLSEKDGEQMVLELLRTSRGRIIITTPNCNIFSRLVKTLVNPSRLKTRKDQNFHLSFYTPKKLEKLGFHVFGILGDTSIKLRFFRNMIVRKLLLPFLFRCPNLSSTLVGTMISST